jgi:hypothetical protein
LLVPLLTACTQAQPCTEPFPIIVALWGQAPLAADLETTPYLYITTTRLDRPSAVVLDRSQLYEESPGVWNFLVGQDAVAAPPALCSDPVWYYPYRLDFELSSAEQLPIDEEQFPPLSFENQEPRKRKGLQLWNGFRFETLLSGNTSPYPNTPVDTATW